MMQVLHRQPNLVWSMFRGMHDSGSWTVEKMTLDKYEAFIGWCVQQGHEIGRVRVV